MLPEQTTCLRTFENQPPPTSGEVCTVETAEGVPASSYMFIDSYSKSYLEYACGRPYWSTSRLSRHLRDSPWCVSTLRSNGLFAGAEDGGWKPRRSPSGTMVLLSSELTLPLSNMTRSRRMSQQLTGTTSGTRPNKARDETPPAGHYELPGNWEAEMLGNIRSIGASAVRDHLWPIVPAPPRNAWEDILNGGSPRLSVEQAFFSLKVAAPFGHVATSSLHSYW